MVPFFSALFLLCAKRSFHSHDICHLQLETLLCGGRDEAWSFEQLRSAVKVDHGFNAESQVVLALLEVMSEFDREERRLFCMFLTGSPNLPVGGQCGRRRGRDPCIFLLLRIALPFSC